MSILVEVLHINCCMCDRQFTRAPHQHPHPEPQASQPATSSSFIGPQRKIFPSPHLASIISHHRKNDFGSASRTEDNTHATLSGLCLPTTTCVLIPFSPSNKKFGVETPIESRKARHLLECWVPICVKLQECVKLELVNPQTLEPTYDHTNSQIHEPSNASTPPACK